MSYIVDKYNCQSIFWDKTDQEKSDRYHKAFQKFVPVSGEASTVHGEILRAVSRLIYDIYNNGLCNDKSAEIRHLLDNLETLSHLLSDTTGAEALLLELLQAHEDREETENLIEYDEEWVEDGDEDGGGYWEEVGVEQQYTPSISLNQERADVLDDITWAAVQLCEQAQ